MQNSRLPPPPEASKHLQDRFPPFAAEQFYANLPDKIIRRHLTEDEQFLALTSSNTAHNPYPRLRRTRSLDSIGSLEEPIELQDIAMAMFSENNAQYPVKEPGITSDPVYESLRYLEGDEAPDLRLYLDDYHMNLRQEIPVSNKTRQPSFRRRLSINRLPFSRASTSMNAVAARDCASPISSTSNSIFSATSSNGTSNKRQSRILSFIQPNRQSMLRSTSPTEGAAATYYQDSDARKTLRACLATPQGFDEALAYGFPSIDEKFDEKKPYQLDCDIGGDSESLHKWHTFFEDDETSTISDNATASEEETPTTPKLDKPLPPIPQPSERELQQPRPRLTHRATSSVSREMTMRMTLTRSDLRSDEDSASSQKGYVARPTHSRAGSLSPMLYIRETASPDPRREMEKRFAEFDYEDAMEQNSNTMKRLWNRVRR